MTRRVLVACVCCVLALTAALLPARAAGVAGAYVTDMSDMHALLRCRVFPTVAQCDGFCAGFSKDHPKGHCDCLAPNCAGPDGKPLPE